jgi:type I restriction enzyme, S subunit
VQRLACSRRELRLEQERKAALMHHFFALREYDAVLGSVASVRYGLGQPPRMDSTGIPIIRATDIDAGRINSERVVRVAREAVPPQRNAFLKNGEILVVRSGAYTGDVAMYDGRWPEAVAGYDLVVTVTAEAVRPEFITQMLLSEPVQRYFRSQRDRSAQPHLNAEQLKSTPIFVPASDVQRLVCETLSACDRNAVALELELKRVEELFDAALDALFTGKVSVESLIPKAQHV